MRRSGVRLAGPPIKTARTDSSSRPEMVDARQRARARRYAAAARKCAGAGIKNGREAGDARGRRRRLTAGYFVGKRVTGWSAGVPRRQSPGLGLRSDSSCVRLLLLCRKGRLPSLRHELHNVELVNGMPASQNKCIIAGERVSTETATKNHRRDSPRIPRIARIRPPDALRMSCYLAEIIVERLALTLDASSAGMSWNAKHRRMATHRLAGEAHAGLEADLIALRHIQQSGVSTPSGRVSHRKKPPAVVEARLRHCGAAPRWGLGRARRPSSASTYGPSGQAQQGAPKPEVKWLRLPPLSVRPQRSSLPGQARRGSARRRPGQNLGEEPSDRMLASSAYSQAGRVRRSRAGGKLVTTTSRLCRRLSSASRARLSGKVTPVGFWKVGMV